MLKRVLFAVALLAMGMLPAGATASADDVRQQNLFVAHLDGAQETPAVQTDARAAATFLITNNDTEIHFLIVARNFDPTHRITQSHIHLGARGVAGPVVVFLFPLTAVGVNPTGWAVGGTLTDADVTAAARANGVTFASIVAAIRAGNAYANIHTTAFPAGETRGQLVPAFGDPDLAGLSSED